MLGSIRQDTSSTACLRNADREEIIFFRLMCHLLPSTTINGDIGLACARDDS